MRNRVLVLFILMLHKLLYPFCVCHFAAQAHPRWAWYSYVFMLRTIRHPPFTFAYVLSWTVIVGQRGRKRGLKVPIWNLGRACNWAIIGIIVGSAIPT